MDALAVGAFSMLGVLTLLFWIAGSIAREFPRNVETAGDLARLLVSHNHRKFAEAAGGTTREQAWDAIRELIARQAGISPSAVRREMRFPEELLR
jgi:hypothetical protein